MAVASALLTSKRVSTQDLYATLPSQKTPAPSTALTIPTPPQATAPYGLRNSVILATKVIMTLVAPTRIHGQRSRRKSRNHRPADLAARPIWPTYANEASSLPQDSCHSREESPVKLTHYPQVQAQRGRRA